MPLTPVAEVDHQLSQPMSGERADVIVIPSLRPLVAVRSNDVIGATKRFSAVAILVLKLPPLFMPRSVEVRYDAPAYLITPTVHPEFISVQHTPLTFWRTPGSARGLKPGRWRATSLASRQQSTRVAAVGGFR